MSLNGSFGVSLSDFCLRLCTLYVQQRSERSFFLLCAPASYSECTRPRPLFASCPSFGTSCFALLCLALSLPPSPPFVQPRSKQTKPKLNCKALIPHASFRLLSLLCPIPHRLHHHFSVGPLRSFLFSPYSFLSQHHPAPTQTHHCKLHTTTLQLAFLFCSALYCCLQRLVHIVPFS
jgi:hypothetical protein